MSRLRLSLLTGFCVCALPLLVRADKPVWAGNGGNNSGSASSGGNWSTGSAPGKSDVAHIDKGRTQFNTPTDLLALEFTTGTGSTTGVLEGNNVLTLLGSVSVAGVTTTQGSTWDAGEMNFSSGGGVIVDTPATLAIGTANSHKLSGGSLTNKGNASWTGGSIDTSSSVTIGNSSGATFTTDFDGTLSNTGTAVFSNDGTFRKSGGNGGKTEVQTTFNNSGTGTIDAAGGTLLLSGGGTSTGNVSVGSGATLQVNNKNYSFSGGNLSGSGTIDINGATTSFGNTTGSANLKVSGGTAQFDNAHTTSGKLSLESGNLSGTGNATVGALDWSAGTLGAKVKSNGATNITGNGTKSLTSELTLGGNTTWDGSTIAVSGSGKLTNNSAFTASADGAITGGSNIVFSNTGTFEKNNGSGGATDIQTRFESTGQIKATAGTLKFSGGGVSSNTVTIGNGAKLKIDGGDFSFNGTTISGTSGTLELASNTTTFSNTTSSDAEIKLTGSGATAKFDGTHTGNGKLTLGNGTVSGSGNATVGSFDWSAGTLGAKVKSNGAATISGAGTKSLTSELTLGGSTTWDGNTIAASGSAKLTNNSAFTATADGAITGSSNIIFSNSGTFEKSAGSNGATDIQTRFESPGQIKATAGTLKFSGGGYTSNTVTIGNGAKLKIDGADFAFSDNSGISGASGTLELANNTTTFGNTTSSAEVKLTGSGATAKFDGTHTGNGKLTLGNGTVSGSGSAEFGSLDWSAGTVGAKVKSNGATTISGAGTKSLTSELTLGGNTTWDGNTIAGSGSGKIINTGNFTTSADGTFSNTGSAVFTNNGTFSKTNGNSATSSTQIQARFENNGTVNISAGKLELKGGGKNGAGGSITIGDLASLDISGDLELLSTSTLQGNGSGRLVSGTLTASGTVAIKTFTFDGGSLGGSHKFTGTVEWNAGDWSATGTSTTTIIDVGGVLNINNGSSHDYNNRSILNKGTVNWKAGAIHGGSGSLFTNDTNAIFNDLNSGNNTLAKAGTFGGSSSFTNNGEYRKSANGKTTVDVPFTNNGSVKVSAGSIVFTDTFTNNGHVNVTNNATAQFANNLNFGSSSTLSGTGTVIAPTVDAAGTVSPGMSPGLLNITGNLTLESTSKLVIEIAGSSPGVSYDLLSVSGTLALNGTLQVTFLNGYQANLKPGDTFTIATGTTGLSGAFTNVASGQQLLTSDGSGYFTVNYGTGSLLAANSVVLSNFVAVPEPSTWTMMGLGGALLLYCERRRKSLRRRR